MNNDEQSVRPSVLLTLAVLMVAGIGLLVAFYRPGDLPDRSSQRTNAHTISSRLGVDLQAAPVVYSQTTAQQNNVQIDSIINSRQNNIHHNIQIGNNKLNYLESFPATCCPSDDAPEK
ncbi:MAG: hypothetical protein ACO1QB_06320 [Verrucomicrobiales bacterium]